MRSAFFSLTWSSILSHLPLIFPNNACFYLIFFWQYNDIIIKQEVCSNDWINTLTPPSDKLEGICDTLNLTVLIKLETCYTNDHKSVIYFSRANRYLFKETLLQNLDSVILGIKFYEIFCFPSWTKKKFFFRNYKKFNEIKFLNNLKKNQNSLLRLPIWMTTIDILGIHFPK